MFTKTAKTILDPVSEAISQLILIHQDAEIKNSALPDLTAVAEVVDAQAKNLSQVGESMLQYGDDLLKQEMPLACQELLKASGLLIEAAAMIKNDPKSKDGRLNLIEACKGILQGTQKILSCHDDQEIRRIVQLCNKNIQSIQQLKEIQEVTHLIEHIRETCQTLVEMTSFGNKRLEEVIHSVVQERLKQDLENIEKCSVLLISGCKLAIQDNKNTVAIEARDLCCDELCQWIEDLEKFVQMTEFNDAEYAEMVGPMAGHWQEIQKQLVDVMKFASSGDVVGLDETLQVLSLTNDALMNFSKNLGQTLKQESGPLKTLIQQLEPVTEKISQLAHKAVKNPSDAQLQSDLYQLLTDASDKYNKLENLSHQLIHNDLKDALNALKNHQLSGTVLSDFHQAVTEGNQQAYQPTYEHLQAKMKTLDNALSQAAMSSQQSHLHRHLKNAQNKLNTMSGQLNASGSAHMKNKNDTNAKEHYNNVLSQWETRVHDLDQLLKSEPFLTVEEEIGSLALGLDQKLASLQNEKNAEKVKAVLNDILLSLERAAGIAKREADSTTDAAYKQKLLGELKDLDGLSQQVKQNLEQLKKTNDVQASVSALNTEKLKNIFGNLNSAIEQKTLKKTEMQMYPAPNKPQLQQIQETEEYKIVDEVQPELLDEEEAKLNPIKAAAQELKVASSQWDPKSNKLVELSGLLAQKMEEISQLYKENTPQAKSDLLKLTQTMQADINALLKHAKQIMDNCKDKQLQVQLQKAIEHLQSLSVQLKIVITVRVSTPKDSESERQLILCAKNLGSSVKTLLNACESASIRAFKSAGQAAVAVVKFKKLVYKGKSGSPKTPKRVMKGTKPVDAFVKTSLSH